MIMIDIGNFNLIGNILTFFMKNVFIYDIIKKKQFKEIEWEIMEIM